MTKYVKQTKLNMLVVKFDEQSCRNESLANSANEGTRAVGSMQHLTDDIPNALYNIMLVVECFSCRSQTLFIIIIHNYSK